MIFRDTLIKIIASVRPSLFYHKANLRSRAGVKLLATDRTLEIFRPDLKQMIRISRENYIYVVDMIESFDYYFGSADPIIIRHRGEQYSLIDFSTPRLHSIKGFSDFPVMSPSLTEPFETIQQYLDFAELAPGGTVLDLGAYSALTSIAFSKAVGPSGRVLALEPDPVNFMTSQKNIANNQIINRLDNICLMSAAISDKSGILQFSSEGAMGSSLTSIVGRHRGTTLNVECITLHDLAEKHELEQIEFIKMDVEGAELATILSSGEFLKKFRPRLMIEPHIVDGQLTSEPIIAFLTELGYACTVIDQTGVSLPLVTAR